MYHQDLPDFLVVAQVLYMSSWKAFIIIGEILHFRRIPGIFFTLSSLPASLDIREGRWMDRGFHT